MSAVVERIERTTSEDRYFDYCLWEYVPVAPPDGKLRSLNVLYNSFDVAGIDDRMYEICEAIRDGLGPARTVWGVKQQNGSLSWELYFYDYQRLTREVSIPLILKIIAPYVGCNLSFSEQRPYFMFSIDLDDELARGARDLSEINVYMGNVGSNVSSGICYSLTAERLRLDNFYFFFDAEQERDDIIAKIVSSAYVDSDQLSLEQILWPQLVHCKTIVVANKKLNDGIYFSRVDVNQLLYFLKRMKYPVSLVDFVERNRGELDHLLYDVAFDYVMRDGEIEILKSSYYGFF